jgi:hypothetical protein
LQGPGHWGDKATYRPSGPSTCSYSPKCLEGVFSEVRLTMIRQSGKGESMSEGSSRAQMERRLVERSLQLETVYLVLPSTAEGAG